MCMYVLMRSGMGKHIGVGFWLACFVVLGIAKASVNGQAAVRIPTFFASIYCLLLGNRVNQILSTQ